jgi:phospholipase/carboxylesterase
MKIMIEDFLQISPINSAAKNLVVMFHGVGSDAQDLINIAPYMQKDLPDTHFISLNGLQKYDMAPFGFQWFSLKNRDTNVMRSEVDKTIPAVFDFLEKKIIELNLSFEQLFLVGFSQGSMLATSIATSFKQKLAGIIGFSGAVILRNFTGNNLTPICLIHGLEDEVIKIELMRRSRDHLKQLGFQVESHEIPFLTHSIDMQGIKIATNFIKNHYVP